MEPFVFERCFSLPVSAIEMPAINDSSRMPRRNPPAGDANGDWSVPLLRLGGFQLSLSYAIFFAVAGLLATVAAAAGREGNEDLVRSALVGSSVWIGGWLLQLLASGMIALAVGLRIGSLTIGLVGLEVRPHTWPPGRTLLFTSSIVVILLFAGSMIWLIGVGWPREDWKIWQPPPLGFSSADSIPHASAWLLWLQALCQLFPLPRTLGRLGMISLVALLTPGSPPAVRLRLARRCLRGAAIATAVIALTFVPLDTQLSVPRWPLLLILAGVLWVSVRANDLRDLIERFSRAVDYEDRRDQQPSLARRFRNYSRSVQRQRRLAEAAKREHEEAVDADQLDAILAKLHQDGLDGLTDQDRAVLQRVSETLRRFRESETEHTGGAIQR